MGGLSDDAVVLDPDNWIGSAAPKWSRCMVQRSLNCSKSDKSRSHHSETHFLMALSRAMTRRCSDSHLDANCWRMSLIYFKLFSSVGECEEVGITGEIKHDCPVSVHGNWFWGVFSFKFKFNFSDTFSVLIIGWSRVESREDIVEVNSFFLDEVEPFWIREGWTSGCVNDTRSDLFRINWPGLKEPESGS